MRKYCTYRAPRNNDFLISCSLKLNSTVKLHPYTTEDGWSFILQKSEIQSYKVHSFFNSFWAIFRICKIVFLISKVIIGVTLPILSLRFEPKTHDIRPIRFKFLNLVYPPFDNCLLCLSIDNGKKWMISKVTCIFYFSSP